VRVASVPSFLASRILCFSSALRCLLWFEFFLFLALSKEVSFSLWLEKPLYWQVRETRLPLHFHIPSLGPAVQVGHQGQGSQHATVAGQVEAQSLRLVIVAVGEVDVRGDGH
jgi:hypothetical protein